MTAAQRPISPEAAGCLLSNRLLAEKFFFGMKRLRAANREGFHYAVFAHETSQKAVDLFFEKAQALSVCAPVAARNRKPGSPVCT
jgi:hypothetical protein